MACIDLWKNADSLIYSTISAAFPSSEKRKNDTMGAVKLKEASS